MQAIIRRFDHAPLEGKLLRANPAQPPKPRIFGNGKPDDHAPKRHVNKRPNKPGNDAPKSAFAAELAKAL
jgi:hypothetical protein